MQETQVWPVSGEDPLEKEWQPTPVFLSGKSHGQRSLVSYSAFCYKESDTTECLSIYIYSFQSWKFSLTSVLGETPKELWGRKWPPFSHPDWWITSWYPGVTDFKVEGGYCKKKKICYKGNQLFLTYRMWTVEGTTDALKSNSLTLQMRKLRLRRGTHPPWIQD